MTTIHRVDGEVRQPLVPSRRGMASARASGHGVRPGGLVMGSRRSTHCHHPQRCHDRADRPSTASNHRAAVWPRPSPNSGNPRSTSRGVTPMIGEMVPNARTPTT